MALPTQYTPGYGYFYTYTTHPNVACNCLREWLPVAAQLARHRGILGASETFRVIQCTGGATASAGTHSLGGAFDVAMLDPIRWHNAALRDYRIVGPRTLACVRLFRDMGAPYWPRIDADGRIDGDPWEGNEHGHGVLNGCPHNVNARYQITEYLRGEDGLNGPGRDTYYRPPTLLTWKQGIAKAKAEMAPKLATPTPTSPTSIITEDDMFTAQDQAWIEARMDAHDQYVIDTVTRHLREKATAEALFTGHNLIKDMRAADPDTAPRVTISTAVERGTLGHRINRGTDSVSALQEIADTRTTVGTLAVDFAALKSTVNQIKDAVSAPKA